MTTTVAVLNQKGGVGKTTVTLGLASAAQAAGLTVLVVDLDPQANSTWCLRVPVEPDNVTVSDVIVADERAAALDAIHPTGWGMQVDALPSTRALLEREGDEVTRTSDARLRKALTGATKGYDYVLIDCPPQLGHLARNALAAADLAVLVSEPAALSVLGIEAVEEVAEDVRTRLNHGLDVAGVILNKVPARGSEAARQQDELNALVGKRNVWQPPIPMRAVVAEALADGTPIHWWGARAIEVIDAFDRHLAHIRRAAAG